MPELPEVEVFRRYLADNVLGRVVLRIHASDAFVRRDVSERELRAAIEGRQLTAAHRHGKWAFLEASPPARIEADAHPAWLVLHFGMTGAPVVLDADAPMPRYPRFVADLADGGRLILDDARRLGGVGLAPSPAAWVAAHHLGPDALVSTLDEVAAALGRRRGRLKPLLMDQTVIAGVGNVYADEILYHARLHPLRRVDDLDDTGILRLAETVHEILDIAVDLGALFHLMPPDWLVHHRSAGGPCPDCRGTVERLTVGGRSTYFCPSCQPL